MTQSQSQYLQDAARLCESGHDQLAMDLVFDKLDRMLIDGRFTEIDADLLSIEVEYWPTSIIRGILSFTFPARSMLANRSQFYSAAVKHFESLGKDTARLLGRLG